MGVQRICRPLHIHGNSLASVISSSAFSVDLPKHVFFRLPPSQRLLDHGRRTRRVGVLCCAGIARAEGGKER
jgi:hypothetical protein